jgi:PAS domain S-box-containing protein
MARNGKDNMLEGERASAELNIGPDAAGWPSALIELALEPILLWDWDAGIIEWNTGAERQYGFTRAEMLGKTSHEALATKHPISLRRFLKRLDADGYWSGEIRHTTKHGRELIVESRQQVFVLDGRKVVLETNRDITDRRAGEGQVALLIVVGELIAKLGDPGELLYAVSRAVGQYFRARRCLFNEIDLENDLETVHRDYCRGVASVAGRHRISAYSSVTSGEMMEGRTVSNADSKTDERTADLFEKTYEPAGERAYIAVPLMRDGQRKASLFMSDDQPREWSPADIKLLEMVGERVWLAIEKRRSEAALRESTARFTKIFNSSPLAVVITSLKDRKLVDVNDSFVKLTGYERSEAIGRTTAELGLLKNPDDRDKALAAFLRDGKIRNSEYHFLTKSGSELVGLVSAELIEIGGDQCALAVIQDITQRKYAEDELRRVAEFDETVMVNMGEGLYTVDAEGEVTTMNPAAEKALGWTLSELRGRKMHDVTHHHYPDGRPFPAEECAAFRVLNDGIPMTDREDVFIRKDGTFFDVVYSSSPLRSGDGSVVGLVVVFRDITERKRADEALRKSEELFSRFMQHLPGLAWVKDVDGRYIYANDAAETAFRTRREDLYGKTDHEVFPQEIAIQFVANDRLAREQGKGLQTIESLEQDDGVLHHSIVSKFPISDADGRTAFVGGMAIDVTDRIRVEEELRRSEERRYLAQEAGNVGIFDWHIIAGKTYWSETMWSIYGEELSTINPDENYWSSHLHDNDRERVKRNIRQVVASAGDEFRDEFRIVRSDGSIRWIEARAKVSRDALGVATRMYGVNTDITARKEAEEKIRISENQLRLVTNAVPALISYVDKNERYRFVNQQFTEWFGIPGDRLIGKGPRDIFGAKAYRVLKPRIDQALSGQECTFETLLSYKNIGDRHVHVSYIPDIGADGIIHGYYGLTHDLTDLRRSEELLRSSEERIQLMMDSFTDYAIFSMNKEEQIDSWNKGAETIFGYSQKEILGMSFEALFTPNDIQHGIPFREMSNVRRKGRASYERWHLKKNGSRFFANSVMMPLNLGTELVGYAVIVSDLTEKKRRSEELQRAHDELEIRVGERTKELAESNAALLQEIQERKIAEKERIDLLGRLVSSQEFERRRIARDLHDQLGQRLTAAKFPNIKISNFGQMDELFYRGARPKAKDLPSLKALGIQTVIDLTDNSKDEQAEVEAAGMKYLNIPIVDKGYPTEENVTAFLKAIDDESTGVFYVHCAGGRHRTGDMGALYRFTKYGWDFDKVYQEMKNYDFYTSNGHGKSKDFVVDYAAKMIGQKTAAAVTPSTMRVE